MVEQWNKFEASLFFEAMMWDDVATQIS